MEDRNTLETNLNNVLTSLGKKRLPLNLNFDEGQGRQFTVGTLVLYRGKLGVVVDLNKDENDPAGSTVDIRLADENTVRTVRVNSPELKFFRA